MKNKTSKLTIQTVVAIGIGTALIFLLKRFGSIPTGFPNTNIDTSYGVLGFLSVIFGPIAGLLMGLLGHALTDFTQYGTPWWSWVITTGFVGLSIGFLSNKINVESGQLGKQKLLAYNLTQIITNVIGWVFIAPVLDILIYAEPANKVFVQGVLSALLNSISAGVIGSLLLVFYAASKTKSGSLRKE